MINTKNKYLFLALAVFLTGCFEFDGKPKKTLKKQSEDDLPYLREAVGQDKLDLLRAVSDGTLLEYAEKKRQEDEALKKGN